MVVPYLQSGAARRNEISKYQVTVWHSANKQPKAIMFIQRQDQKQLVCVKLVLRAKY